MIEKKCDGGTAKNDKTLNRRESDTCFLFRNTRTRGHIMKTQVLSLVTTIIRNWLPQDVVKLSGLQTFKKGDDSMDGSSLWF